MLALLGAPRQAVAADPLDGQACGPNQSCPTTTGNGAGPGSRCGSAGGGSTCAASNAPAALSNSSSPSLGVGNPINVASGNKYQRETDMAALPGVLGLELVRHYNSAYSGATAPNGILGRGWKLSYETELYASDTSLQIAQADGSRLTFDRDPAHPSLCSSTDPSHGQVLIERYSRGEHYTWRSPDGRRLSFDSDGHLTQIAVQGTAGHRRDELGVIATSARYKPCRRRTAPYWRTS